MEHTYVLLKDHKAYLIALVSDSNANGRYCMYDFTKNNVRHEYYESKEDFEKMLDDYCDYGRIDTWAKITLSSR